MVCQFGSAILDVGKLNFQRLNKKSEQVFSKQDLVCHCELWNFEKVKLSLKICTLGPQQPPNEKSQAKITPRKMWWISTYTPFVLNFWKFSGLHQIIFPHAIRNFTLSWWILYFFENCRSKLENGQKGCNLLVIYVRRWHPNVI